MANLVDQGKLPDAFYKIQDLEAQRFVGKCLANVSERLPANELLLDPFLAMVQLESPSPSPSACPSSPRIQTLNSNSAGLVAKVHPYMDDQTENTNMTITGTMNEEDNTVFLKVQISDKNGMQMQIAAFYCIHSIFLP